MVMARGHSVDSEGLPKFCPALAKFRATPPHGISAGRDPRDHGLAAVRVRLADGPPQRIGHKAQQHLPGDEVWLIGEQRIRIS